MTRKELEEQFDVVDGRITNPGKFEGEAVYVPHFWDAFLNGEADRDDGTIVGFNVTKEDKAMFPELKGRRTVRIYERDDGFVCEC